MVSKQGIIVIRAFGDLCTT